MSQTRGLKPAACLPSKKLEHYLRLEGMVTLQESNTLSAQCLYSFSPVTQLFALHYRLAVPERTLRGNLYHDYPRRNNRYP